MQQAHQQGYVLFTGLIFMLVLAVIGVSAMQTTNIEYRMSSNTAFKKQAFARGESGRSAISDVLSDHLAAAGTWPTSLTLPSGLVIRDKDSDGVADDLSQNGGGETPAAPIADADYQIDYNTDGDLTDTADIDVAISTFWLKSKKAVGAGLGDSSGTLGAGKGVSGGGFHMFFQVRADGTAPSQARSNVLVDYRHIP